MHGYIQSSIFIYTYHIYIYICIYIYIHTHTHTHTCTYTYASYLYVLTSLRLHCFKMRQPSQPSQFPLVYGWLPVEAEGFCIGPCVSLPVEAEGFCICFVLHMRSATIKFPSPSTASPRGKLKDALAPGPSMEPSVPEPAKVVTTPLGVIFRIRWLL